LPIRSAARCGWLKAGCAIPAKNYCVFVFYQAKRAPQDFSHLFAALKSCDINLILVANALPPGGEALLAPHCHTLLVRNNFGRDFGGFQAGVRFAQALAPSRLLLNDNVHFLEKGFFDYIDQMCSDHPFIGATASAQIALHVQSYAMSFGRDVLESEAFRSFWADYHPMNEKR
jgi:lipopolysaccharide biosynthesis protein